MFSLEQKCCLREDGLAGEERRGEALPLIDYPRVMLEPARENTNQRTCVEQHMALSHAPKPFMYLELIDRRSRCRWTPSRMWRSCRLRDSDVEFVENFEGERAGHKKLFFFQRSWVVND